MTRRFPFLLALLAVSACDVKNSATAPTPAAGTTVYYTALGASDADGYGSSVPCLPFADCPTGKGYVPEVARRLQAEGLTVTLLNMGIPGDVLSPSIQTIGNAVGRNIFGNFLDQEMPFVPRESTLVTIFAGGNDANAIGAAIDAGLGGADPTTYVQTQIQTFGRDFQTLIAGVKNRAPLARIVVLNLPNLAALPYAANDTATQKHWLQTIAVGFSAQANAVRSQGALVIDLMCDAGVYDPARYSSDGFHPNDAGYAHVADLMYPAARTGSAAAPLGSCAQQRLF